MNKIFPALAVAAALASCSHKEAATDVQPEINVLTYNIRYDNPDDSLNNWQYRRDRAANAIRFYEADIIGTQEVLHNQRQDLKERLPEYTAIGVAREDGKEEGEYNVLWFKTDRFENLDSGTFWLSETPDVAGSLGWDGACKRIATWARLRDKESGKTFLALNTHLDHVGETARREGVSLMFDKVKELSQGAPAIVTGDFNSTPDSDVIKHVTDENDPGHLTDSRAVSPIVYGPSWSFHDFGEIPYEHRPLLDYVFVKGDLDVMRYGVLAEMENGEYLSDHAPVLVTVKMK